VTIAAQDRRYALHVTKKRLDVLMVERGLAETRSQAQALVLAGKVPGHAKAGEKVDESTEIEVEAGPRFVSRGGEKLANALATFAVEVEEEDCLDVGASTGGFTDCLLQAGAARVCALDVGYGQLHPKLRDDPRVTVMERVNVRNLDCAELPFRPAFVTCDVSFISLAKAGREEVGKGGVVRDPEVHKRVVDKIAEQAPDWGARVEGVADSGLPGPKGNREFFLYLRAA
jgi:23S rRNA (cytidine1920-2'-O)/16S rRNA (cytidine1409-2'-O)-methyltransferase